MELAGRRSRPCRRRPDWLPVEKLQHEFDAIGFYLSSHPLEAYGKSLDRLGVVKGRRTSHRASRWRLDPVQGRRHRGRQKGTQFGARQPLRFRAALRSKWHVRSHRIFGRARVAARPYLDSGTPLLLTIDAREDGDTLRLTAQAVEPLIRRWPTPLPVCASASTAPRPCRCWQADGQGKRRQGPRVVGRAGIAARAKSRSCYPAASGSAPAFGDRSKPSPACWRCTISDVGGQNGPAPNVAIKRKR